MRGPKKRQANIVAIGSSIFGAFAAVGGVGVAIYAWRNTTFGARGHQAVTNAGFAERQASVGSRVKLNYAEGPDNGPAVLLVHAQAAAWESYEPVLVELSEEFHVFAVDVVGHGSSSRTPGHYDVSTIGAQIVDFIYSVIGEPVLLSGHSSGGLIAAWVAANAKASVTGVLFEDPPFFSTDPARMPKQFNYVDLDKPAHEFLRQDDVTDFASWYIEHNAWITYFGRGKQGIVRHAKKYRERHADEPLNIWFLPPSVNESYRFMHQFDPEFADAFYALTWQEGFDQAATLSEIAVPTTLVHANWRITEQGILEGAMTDDDAQRASGLLADNRLERVLTGHSFHNEDPHGFVTFVRELQERFESR